MWDSGILVSFYILRRFVYFFSLGIQEFSGDLKLILLKPVGEVS